MQFKFICLSVALLMFASASVFAQGQSPTHRSVMVPETTVERLQDKGLRAHTNHLIRMDAKPNKPGPRGPSGETPASIRAVYNLPSSGGAGTIAIVDAFHYATAENDLNVFSQQFGLPACTTANGCFKKVFANGTQPQANCGWGQEAALDIEWAHAMAPTAKIVLVEAASNSFTDLFHAVDVATSQVTSGGGVGQVSMSWSGGEFSTEASNDGHFQNNGVVYFAASQR
jgi:kumamolisin